MTREATGQLLLLGFRAHQAGNLAVAEQNYAAVLSASPDHFAALHLLALVRVQHKAYEEADRLFETALAIRPNCARTLYDRGIVLQALMRHDEALASYDRALEVRTDHAEALNNRGIVLERLGRHEEALASYDKSLAIRPSYIEALRNRGTVLRVLDRCDEALASYDRALAIEPSSADTLFNRAMVLQELHRYHEALEAYDRELKLRPDHAEALNNRGNALRELGHHQKALASYDRALAIKPESANTWYNRGVVLQQLKRHDQALADYHKALALQPDHCGALNNGGLVLLELKRYDEALEAYDRLLAIKPEQLDAASNRALVLRALRRYDEALESYDKALQLEPNFVDALCGRGDTLRDLKRADEALACYEAVLALEPRHPRALNALANTALVACDWTRIAGLVDELSAGVSNRTAILNPITFFCYDQNPSLQLECARAFARHVMPVLPERLWNGEIWRHDKIRIAYLSGDFRQHATAVLISELIELHNRSRFEVLGISLGPDDGSSMRARLTRAFDQFHDMRTISDYEVAKRLCELGVDIAVDLMGFAKGCRPGILAHRPAPIQVNYLGYPGTMSVDFIDYVVADKVALPFDQQPFYSEKIVHLPDSFQVNDQQRSIGARTPTRQEVGLPDRGFVFCCFNNNWKIAASVFDVWMRLLHSVEASMLWLLRDNDSAASHLRVEAFARGIDPARLVFAGRTDLDAHLARHRVADLFLDTLPYNAHTTASDALWAGLPVVTCCGKSFAGRVAASLLHAVGLPELVTADLEEYRALAMRLATDPRLLAGFKERLERSGRSSALFDSSRFRRHIEAAYVTMWEYWQRGERPRSFSVEP